MDNYKMLLAHYDESNPDKSQLLIDHLLNAADHSKDLGELVEMKSSSQLIGLIHDFGKSSNKFQSYIRGQYRGRVDHSSAGGIIIDYISDKVYQDLFFVEDSIQHLCGSDKMFILITYDINTTSKDGRKR